MLKMSGKKMDISQVRLIKKHNKNLLLLYFCCHAIFLHDIFEQSNPNRKDVFYINYMN